MKKILIIRLSSIGDIIQCMGVVGGLKEKFPDACIEWVVRSDMQGVLSIDKRIDKIHAFDKREGFKGLLRLAKQLRKERFDYIYDAHSNIRSAILKTILLPPACGYHPRHVMRSKQYFNRMLLFKFRINRFDKPFRGVISFRKPLAKWGVTAFPNAPKEWDFPSSMVEKFDNLITPRRITLVPSANWETKRWPVSHWQELVRIMPEYEFVILGGPADTFCEDIAAVAPERTLNMAGKTSIMESCFIVSRSNMVVSGDTGFLHAADMFGIPTLALMGPTAFGFPTGKTVEILEIDLPCRPCTKDGRGACKLKEVRKCMVDITPALVAERIKKKMK